MNPYRAGCALGLVLVGLLVLSAWGPTVAIAETEGQEWPMQGHDSQRSSSIGASQGGIGSVTWVYDTGSPKTADSSMGVSAPSLAYGLLYVGTTDRHLHAIDQTSGERAWQERLRTGEIPLPPVVSNGTLAVSAVELFGLDPLTGQTRWQLGGEWRSPAFSDSTLVAPADARFGSGNMTGIEPPTGRERWTINQSTGAVDLLVHEDNVIGADLRGRLFAIDVTTRAVEWITSPLGADPGHPVLDGGTLVVEAGDLYAFDATTGEPAWSKRGAYNQGRASTLAAGQGTVYVFDGAHLEAVDTSTRETRFETSFEQIEHLTPTNVAVTESTLYVAFRTTGVAGGGLTEGGATQEADEETMDGSCHTTGPYGTAKGDRGEARLFAVNTTTGTVTGALNGTPQGFMAPAIGDGALFAAGQDGCIYRVSTTPSTHFPDEGTGPGAWEDGDQQGNGSHSNATGGPTRDTDWAGVPGTLALLLAVGTCLRRAGPGGPN